eukprot:TRINITY_DN5601_c0_g3_i1.p1 TRINITY_DN5601_c0_g3~~TRINITY_DN5601_c0_g3_i1.p1  ORF type:complete len:521 (+),score=-12.80 TRINITY_DN5601_c0_g3_i1:120-1682(+)
MAPTAESVSVIPAANPANGPDIHIAAAGLRHRSQVPATGDDVDAHADGAESGTSGSASPASGSLSPISSADLDSRPLSPAILGLRDDSESSDAEGDDTDATGAKRRGGGKNGKHAKATDLKNLDLAALALLKKEDGSSSGVDTDSDKEGEAKFDASAAPPFSLADVRAAIPKHCFEKNARVSLEYLAVDVALMVAVGALAYVANSWFVWPVYFLVQSIVFCALFVVGHDCNHGSFSNYKLLNDVVGHLTHTALLTPYHGWRISHRTHHANHGHAENDESWVPVTKEVYDTLTWWKYMRYHLPFPLFMFPIYLWIRTPGKTGSHYNPNSPIFEPKEANDVILSTTLWTMTLAFYAYLTFQAPGLMVKMYWVPYVLHVWWLAACTYLHHHGYKEKLPWYRGEEWSYLRGGLTTLDRDYGILEVFTHSINIHVAHHLFPAIPHYHLVEATNAMKPVLGRYYREPRPTRGFFPFHLVRTVKKSVKTDHYVSSEGNIIFYQQDKNFRSLRPFMPWAWGQKKAPVA